MASHKYKKPLKVVLETTLQRIKFLVKELEFYGPFYYLEDLKSLEEISNNEKAKEIVRELGKLTHILSVLKSRMKDMSIPTYRVKQFIVPYKNSLKIETL